MLSLSGTFTLNISIQSLFTDLADMHIKFSYELLKGKGSTFVVRFCNVYIIGLGHMTRPNAALLFGLTKSGRGLGVDLV